MNDRSDIDLVLGAWFEDGPEAMPDRVADAVATRIAKRPQRRSSRHPWMDMLPRVLLYGTAVAAALAVAVLAWNFAGPNVGAGPTESPGAVPAASSSQAATTTEGAASPACTPADIDAADSRNVGGTSVDTGIKLIRLADPTCTLAAYPTMVLRGSDGAELARTDPKDTARVNVRPNWFFASHLVVTSWCGPSSALPLSLELLVDGVAVPIAGWTVEDPAELPACNAGAGTVITATQWVGSPPA